MLQQKPKQKHVEKSELNFIHNNKQVVQLVLMLCYVISRLVYRDIEQRCMLRQYYLKLELKQN